MINKYFSKTTKHVCSKESQCGIMMTHTHFHPHTHPTHRPRRGKGERGEGERALTVMECPRPHLLKSLVNLNHWHYNL